MFATRLVAGVLMAGAAAVGSAVVVEGVNVAQAAPAGASSAGAPSASTLYKEAVATTHAWSVHYASRSTSSNQTLVESGDAGPASASQTVTMGTGTISILVIGGFTYVKGNAAGLENLAGLSSSQATGAAGQWIEFATKNTAFAPVVQGVRSTDIAKELALKAPLSLGHTRTLDGQAVDAIEGTQTFGRTSQHVILYVRARGNPCSGGGGLRERQGKAHDRRAHRLLQVGRAHQAAGAEGHHLHRLHKRRLRKADHVLPCGRGKICPVAPWPSWRSTCHRAGPPGE